MSTMVVDELEAVGTAARQASRELAALPAEVKDRALRNVAESLRSHSGEVLDANAIDCAAAREKEDNEAPIDRLLLTPERLDALADDVLKVVGLPDPVGLTLDSRTMDSGLRVERRSVPLGVIGAIYESRPDVTIDISSLCVKSGNAVILRGGSEAFNSNRALAGLAREAIVDAGVPGDAVQFIESTDRALVGRMLRMRETIDLLVPRGGSALIHRVAEEAAMPAITGGIGVCHTYVDRDADLDMALSVVNNAKVQRPSVCNALDTVIVHSAVAPAFLPRIAALWANAGVEMRADRRAMSVMGPVDSLRVVPAEDADWSTEYLDLIAGVRVVDSFNEALDHIADYGSGHTEAIITENSEAADRFLDLVDASVVVVNASTRFNDGAQMGLGAEVAISTNKIHARGPMGLRELTSYKWTVVGTGQTRS